MQKPRDPTTPYEAVDGAGLEPTSQLDAAPPAPPDPDAPTKRRPEEAFDDAPVRPDPLLGRVLLDQFRVMRQLGAGGMGVVYLADQLGTTRHVVMKTLRPELVDPTLRRRFLQEGRMLASLQHPNIVTVYNVGALPDDTLFLVMEYLEGRELAEILAEGPLPVERVLRIGEQIAKALVAAHQIGIVHRDLKPPNVMILQSPGEEPDLAKVLDFGIARPVFEDESKLTSTGMVLGTPQYMSPEQAQGEKVGPPSDVYNLGLILYRALTGELAIRGRTPVDYLRAHVMDLPTPIHEIPAVAGLPAVLADVIMRCLAKDAAARPTAQEVVDALRAHRTLLSFKKLTGTTSALPEPDATPHEAQAAGTSRLALPAVALVVLFGLLVGGVLFFKPKTGAAPQASTPPVVTQAEPPTPTATQDPAPAAKETVKADPVPAPSPANDLVSLPAGTALVLEGDKNIEHSVPAFRIERDEVTAAKYAECVSAKACAPSFLAGRAEYAGPDLPAVGVTPDMARAYCEWRGRRLPSRAEWIRAARGDRDLPWPVDPDQADLSRCCNLDGADDGFAGLAPVGRPSDASLAGVRDLTGNVSEWIQAGNTEGAGEAMGGSWKLSLEDARVDVEHVFPPGSWFPFVGFRCAADEAKP